MPLPIKISLVTIPLILLLAYFAIDPAIGRPKRAEAKDMAAQKAKIDASFKEATALVNAAVESHDVAKMRAARERWNVFQAEWELFTIAAKQWSNWTEEDCDRYWDGALKAHDVQGRLKLLNDDISSAFGPGSGRSPQSDGQIIAVHKANINDSFKEAAAMVNAAVESHDVVTMREAHDRWHNFQYEWELFTIAAKQSNNWTEEDCDRYWNDELKAPDLQTRIKLLNDEIAKQSVDK